MSSRSRSRWLSEALGEGGASTALEVLVPMHGRNNRRSPGTKKTRHPDIPTGVGHLKHENVPFLSEVKLK